MIRSAGAQGEVLVALDLDDNLARTEHVALTEAHRYAQELIEQLGLPPIGPLQQFISDHPGKTFRNIMFSICEGSGLKPDDSTLNSWAAEEKNRILDRFKRSGLESVPGTDEMLDFLQRSQAPHPVVTSSHPDRAKLTLEVANLSRFFLSGRDDIFSAQDPNFDGNPKPAPDIYNFAFTKFDAGLIRIAEEDSPSGVASAIAAGAFVVGNVGALEKTNRVARMQTLLERGALIVIENNASMIALIEHITEYEGEYKVDNLISFIKRANWCNQYQNNELKSGRPVFLHHRLVE